MKYQAIPPRLRFVDNNGNALVGGKVYTYATGTSDPQATYTDSTGSAANTNPIILDSRGEADIWLTDGVVYRFVTKTSADVEIDTTDGISSGNGLHDVTGVYGQSELGWILNNGPVDVGGYPYLVSASQTSTYNATQINAAAVFASATKRPLKFPPGIIKIDAECTTAVYGLIGQGEGATTIKADAAMTKMFTISGAAKVELFTIDGNNQSKYGFTMAGSNLTEIKKVIMQNFTLDAIDFSVSGNNNGASVDQSIITNCGTIYSTGTASGTATGTTVTIAGAADLTTFVRPGYDMWKTATNDSNLCNEITAVSANTLTVWPPISTTFTTQAYAIHQGNGINIRNYSDNAKIRITRSTFQNCKVAGVSDKALYGANIENCIFEFNEYHHIIGNKGMPFSTFASCYSGNYYEGAFDDDYSSLFANSNGDSAFVGYTGSHSPRYLAGSLPVMSVGSTENGLVSATPADASGAGLAFTSVTCYYMKLGRQITVSFTLTYPSTADASQAKIKNFAPFPILLPGVEIERLDFCSNGNDYILGASSSTDWQVLTLSGGAVANSSLSLATLAGTITYFT